MHARAARRQEPLGKLVGPVDKNAVDPVVLKNQSSDFAAQMSPDHPSGFIAMPKVYM